MKPTDMQRKPYLKVTLLLAIAIMMIYTIPYTSTYAEFVLYSNPQTVQEMVEHSFTHSVNCPLS